MRSFFRLLAVAAPLLLLVAAPARAADVKRRGVQIEALAGGSICVPGHAACKSSAELVGTTGPSLGLGFFAGFRPLRVLMVGVSYNAGFFDPRYLTTGDADAYRLAYQNSVFATLRGIIPLWRLDLGLEIGPGFSRQTFRARDGALPYDREFSQGFALKTAPSIDIYLTRRFFLGAKVDFLWNFHGKVCQDGGAGRTCSTRADTDRASVHQMIAGLHFGATF